MNSATKPGNSLDFLVIFSFWFCLTVFLLDQSGVIDRLFELALK